MNAFTGFSAVGLALLIAGFTFAGCSSSDSSGGNSGTGGSGATGGSSGGTGGSSATGGTGGSAGGACEPEPDPSSSTACDTCQDTTHGECVCATESAACDTDADCTAIYDCAYSGTGTVGPCDSLDATGAACEYACIALHPAGKALYLAYEKCMFCNYCTSACGDTTEYCGALDSPPDGGTDAETDAGTDASYDATTD